MAKRYRVIWWSEFFNGKMIAEEPEYFNDYVSAKRYMDDMIWEAKHGNLIKGQRQVIKMYYGRHLMDVFDNKKKIVRKKTVKRK